MTYNDRDYETIYECISKYTMEPPPNQIGMSSDKLDAWLRGYARGIEDITKLLEVFKKGIDGISCQESS